MITQRKALSERIINRLIQAAGYLSILFVSLICLFLLREGLPALFEVDIPTLLGTRWYPIEDLFGIWPLLFGSLIVTLGATLIAVPLGVVTAVFISEVAPPGQKKFSNRWLKYWLASHLWY